jgi:hypothetical protein
MTNFSTATFCGFKIRSLSPWYLLPRAAQRCAASPQIGSVLKVRTSLSKLSLQEIS